MKTLLLTRRLRPLCCYHGDQQPNQYLKEEIFSSAAPQMQKTYKSVKKQHSCFCLTSHTLWMNLSRVSSKEPSSCSSFHRSAERKPGTHTHKAIYRTRISQLGSRCASGLFPPELQTLYVLQNTPGRGTFKSFHECEAKCSSVITGLR